MHRHGHMCLETDPKKILIGPNVAKIRGRCSSINAIHYCGCKHSSFLVIYGAENLRLVRCVELVQRHNLTLPRESHGPVCRRSFRARHSCPVLGGAVWPRPYSGNWSPADSPHFAWKSSLWQSAILTLDTWLDEWYAVDIAGRYVQLITRVIASSLGWIYGSKWRQRLAVDSQLLSAQLNSLLTQTARINIRYSGLIFMRMKPQLVS
jgi:hypothetical protein